MADAIPNATAQSHSIKVGPTICWSHLGMGFLDYGFSAYPKYFLHIGMEAFAHSFAKEKAGNECCWLLVVGCWLLVDAEAHGGCWSKMENPS